MASLSSELLVNISEREVIHYTELAYMTRISPDYAHLICSSLSKDGYIVIDAAGMCKITPKGKNFLKERTLSK